MWSLFGLERAIMNSLWHIPYWNPPYPVFWVRWPQSKGKFNMVTFNPKLFQRYQGSFSFIKVICLFANFVFSFSCRLRDHHGQHQNYNYSLIFAMTQATTVGTICQYANQIWWCMYPFIHSAYFPFLLLCFVNSVYIMIAQRLHGMERRNLYKMIKKATNSPFRHQSPYLF